MSTKFFEALEAVADDKGLTIESVLECVRVAMERTWKGVSTLPYEGAVELDYDLDKKTIKFYNVFYVVKEDKKKEDLKDVEGSEELETGKEKKPLGVITIEQAKVFRAHPRNNDKIKSRIDLKEFGRKAAASFRQNFTNELKNLERDAQLAFFSDKVGEIINGRVCAINDKFVTFDIGKDVEATMGQKDMLPDETYTVDDVLKLYIVKVEKTPKGPKVYISRSHKDFVRKLFELNIPEVANGQIEIMAVARDAGHRSKVGVLALNDDIDAKGACVGQGGGRIKSINAALNGEKIDIFVWKGNAIELISEALSPAKVVSVMANEEEKKAVAIVTDDQFSLAIGAKGQNAKLAVLATGWKIDIKKLSDAQEEGFDFKYNVNM